MNISLKEKTLSGLTWSFADSFVILGVNFIVGIILARILTPQEFGLVGMVTIFIAVSQSFIDSGFGHALIRKSECSQEDYSTVFYYNLFVGIIIYLVLFFSAGLISNFFQEPKLFSLVRVLSFTLLLNSVSVIQRTILIKDINFKLLTKKSFIASLLSGVVSIAMAYYGYGVWSLVFKAVSFNFISSFLLWRYNSWRPKLLFSLKSFHELFGFGSKLLISGLINTIYNNIYHLVIGKYFSAADLGYFTRAEHFQKLPTENIYKTIDRVSYPVLSSVQNNQLQLKSSYKKIIKNTMFITFVLTIGLAAVAEALVLTLIGKNWLPSVPYLQLLCFYGMLYPLHALNLNMLKVKGRSDLFLRLEVLKKIIAVPVIIIGIYYGIIAMIIGMIVNSFIAYFLNSYWSGKMIKYPMMEQILDITPSFFVALLMGISVFTAGHLLNFLPVIVLAIQVLMGAVIVLSISELFKIDTYGEMKDIVINILLNLKPKKKELRDV